jgi:ATP-binding protein involved in chromosome partitioning
MTDQHTHTNGHERADDRTDADPGDGAGRADDLGDRVEAALRKVRDPDAGLDAFEAGLIESVDATDGRVTVEADLSEFDPDGREAVTATMLRAVREVEGVEGAHVEHANTGPDVEGRDVGVAGVDTVIAVASAKGGVGKSTVATALACALAGGSGRRVGLFDADVHGPNVPSLLGVDGPVYADDEGHPVPVETGGMEVMSVGLLEDGAPLAWRGAMAHDALTDLFEGTAWDGRDTLVVDLPPGTGDVVLTTLQEVPVDGVVVVTTPFHAAVSDTERSVELFRENDVPVLGTVVNMGSFACPSCGDEHELFPDGSPLEDHDAPVLAELPFAHEMQRRPAPGDVPDPVGSLAESVDDRLEEIWDVTVPEGAVDLRGLDSDARRERVREAFEALEPGAEFALVSDRDPTPVRGFLAEVTGVEPGAFERFEVRKQNPETWHLRTVRPRQERPER